MRLYLMTLMALLAFIAVAQSNRIYIEDFEIEPEATLTVPVVLANQDSTCGFQFGMTLPRGLEVKDIRLTDSMNKMGFRMNHSEQGANCMVMVYSLRQEYCVPDTVEVLEIDFSAHSGFKGGDIVLCKCRGAAAGNQCIYMDDGTAHVAVPSRSLIGVPIDQQQGDFHFNNEE